MSIPSPQKPDNDLLSLFAQTGDLEVLGVLYQRYMHLVYGVCLKYFKNRDTAKEGVVAIFEKLMVELPKQQVDNFKPWLYVVTKNYCLMELRKQKSGWRREQIFMENAPLFMESDIEVHPLDSDDNQGLTDALQHCIEQLKAEQKQCIELFYYNDKCYAEISEQLNMDLKKVKSHIQNGKRNLKICLDNKHEVPFAT
jgi:RNA polymerase sigma-70 factor, ECF subfamily